jgi:hypothetical protein
MPRPVRLGLILVPVIAGLAFGGWYVYKNTRPGPADPQHDAGTGSKPTTDPATGKLVVLVVFDHLRGEDLDRWAPAFGPDGFERLKKTGVWYADCRLPYATTFSAPGHASVITGVPPSAHGVVGDVWYDRAAGAVVGPDRLPPPAAPTVTGKGRTVSLSLKRDTAAILGGTGASAAYWFDTATGQFAPVGGRDGAHPWADEVNRSGAANRRFGSKWEPIQAADDGRFRLATEITGKGYGSGQRRTFPHPFDERATSPGPGYYIAVATSPYGDELLLELARKAVAGEKLGSGPNADLLCLGFSATDCIAREWGPDSPEAFDAVVRADKLVADLLRFLDEKMGRDHYVLVLTAAHGMASIPEQSAAKERRPAAKRVKPAPVLTRLAAALDATFGPSPTGPAGWFEPAADPHKLWPWVYLNRGAIEARGVPPDRVARFAAEWLGNRPEMLAGFARSHLETGMLPPTGTGRETEVRAAFEAAKRSLHPARSGDVLVVPQPGVVVTPDETGTLPGSPHAYDSNGPLLVAGAGVPAAGKRAERVTPLAAAPIVAWALGVPPPAGAAELPGEFSK